MIKLTTISIFPIKSFIGENLNSANLEIGSGLIDDRRFSIAISPEVDGTKWLRNKAFMVNSRHDDMQKLKLDRSADLWTITKPDGNSLSFNPNSQESIARANKELPVFLEDLLEADLTPRLVQRVEPNKNIGMWDYPDTLLSLTNLESVRDFSKSIGVELSPDRFRGNLLIEGLPAWEEFGFAGKLFSLGEAEIAFTRPIDRCPATTINPKTGDRDVKTPALLAERLGHGYFGMGAHVVKSGAIKPNDKLIEIGTAQAKHIDHLVSNAPAHQTWPKFATISNVTPNSEGTHITLKSASPWPLLETPQTNGKRMRLHLGADNIVTANIEKIDADAITISVPTELNLVNVQKILVSGPFGKIR